ncbi:MAG: hypothetical protein AAB540_02635, partial [Patescibacteria group bacterium]
MKIKSWIILGIGILVAILIMLTYKSANKNYRFASVLNEQNTAETKSDLHINSGVKIIRTATAEQASTPPLTWFINTALAKGKNDEKKEEISEEVKPKKIPIKKKLTETGTTTADTGTSTDAEILEPFKIFEQDEWLEFRDNGKTIIKGDILSYKILLQNNAITPV